MKILHRAHSEFYHRESNLEFHSTLDRRKGVYVGVADVPDDEDWQDKHLDWFESRPVFEVLEDAELAAILAPEPKPFVTSGDPLIDAAHPEGDASKDDLADAPPAPPSEKTDKATTKKQG